ncbi:MAG TPA: NAD(P)-binding domain-containing protein [Candidatus Didemnitutus sp.]|nr:NAD(P)-binding domain-containing protein [Candidatus Didemnitutus sp.]
MKIAVLGTGMVGEAIAGRLVEVGHDVRMGSRTRDNPKAITWVNGAGSRASQGTFADAAAFGEMVFHCAHGQAALEVLAAAGPNHLGGKVLIDVSNPLGMATHPPSLLYCNTTSLAERIQAAHPAALVVKTLNTMNCAIMVRPRQLAGSHNVFLSGNDPGAKERVAAVLRSFGWTDTEIVDLGGITTARGSEMIMPLWLSLWGALGTAEFNFSLVRG